MTIVEHQALSLKDAGGQRIAGQARPVLVGVVKARDVQVETVSSLPALEDIKDAWMDLADRALDANFSMTPAKALAAIRHLENADQGFAVLVWQAGKDAATPRRLLGLFPLEFSKMRWGIPVRSAEIWQHIYAISGTPLVDRQLAQVTINAFVTWLKTDQSAPRFLHIARMVKGPVYDALIDALSVHGMAVREYDSYERAILETDKPGEDYLRESLGRKRSKEYRRIRNRLGDLGQVEFRMRVDREETEDALQRFFDLEKAGWKGARGTALACRDDWRGFFTDTVLGLADTGQSRIAELRLDGRVIAATIIVTSQDTAWMWKIAFDEALSKYSPGVLLVLDVTTQLIADEDIARVDSCAVADHPMINRIWRERLGVTDLLITTRPGIVPGALIQWLEQTRRDARAAIKSIYKIFIKETHHG
jgi:CelD/BcsL family acetyltransferase involved in cellulose biosynthesis